MSNNNQKSSDSSKRSQKSPLRQRPSKILRVDDPNFEHEVLLESDQSETEENIEDCLVYEDTLIQNHDSDEGEDERNPSSEGNPSPAETPGSEPDDDSSDDDVPIAELRQRPPQYYYGKNRFKWSTNPPSSRVRTAQHNIVMRRRISCLTEADTH
ncbi:uncharacterized protein LOC126911467 [Spodoptera frugiperda]|uniref:Uncharacterized protein LOC126911467 n=1 Tax=Spodoptera frugiperda TaxID=7108 RepID=A0A9R0DW88_SPOFR|nr:uncharacterized protein LOC126911467 [Spodoptera frugiperda]